MKTAAPPKHSKILILDFGSQYTQVIARRIRELQVYSEVVPFDLPAAEIKNLNPNGIVLSGGPASVYDKGAPQIDPGIFSLGIPVLGICYGLMQMARHLGGQVVFTGRREYGAGMLHITNGSQLFDGLGNQLDVWNSHGDEVTSLPKGFIAAGTTESSNFAAVEDRQRKLYGLQFHPEVAHTPRGKEILQNFVYHICRCAMDWTMGSFIEEACERVRKQVGDEKVVLGLSGGVDSSVTAALLHKAIGDQLTCIFVNNGLLRAREEEIVQRVFGENFHVRLKYVDATERFLTALKGVTVPGPGTGRSHPRRSHTGAIVDLARSRHNCAERNESERLVLPRLAIVRRPFASALGRRDGRPTHLRKHDRAPHRRKPGRHDCRL